MCQLCFKYTPRAELHQIEPGVVEDICISCHQDELITLNRPQVIAIPWTGVASCLRRVLISIPQLARRRRAQ
jgi:hypothetical protein